MKMHYATEVRSLSVNLPSQYGYPNERNLSVNRPYNRKKIQLSVPKSNCTAHEILGIDNFYENANW